MKLLTVKELKEQLSHYADDEPVYLGDDEELNGLHGAYFVQRINKSSVHSMNEYYDGAGILIS